jgi:hypothetical protein
MAWWGSLPSGRSLGSASRKSAMRTGAASTRDLVVRTEECSMSCEAALEDGAGRVAPAGDSGRLSSGRAGCGAGHVRWGRRGVPDEPMRDAAPSPPDPRAIAIDSSTGHRREPSTRAARSSRAILVRIPYRDRSLAAHACRPRPPRLCPGRDTAPTRAPAAKRRRSQPRPHPRDAQGDAVH